MARSDIDWVLAGVLDDISGLKTRLGLTVFSGGFAISGMVVPEEVYFRTVGLDSVADDVADPGKATFSEATGLENELARDDIVPSARVRVEMREDLERAFITMVDVTIFGAGPTPLKAPAWRGRLSQVSGWTFGTYEAAEVTS